MRGMISGVVPERLAWENQGSSAKGVKLMDRSSPCRRVVKTRDACLARQREATRRELPNKNTLGPGSTVNENVTGSKEEYKESSNTLRLRCALIMVMISSLAWLGQKLAG